MVTLCTSLHMKLEAKYLRRCFDLFPLPGVVGLRVAGGGIVRRLPAKMHETRDSLANDVIGRYISTLGPQTTPARLSNALVVPAA